MEPSITLEFLGAAGTVTGSKTLIRYKDYKILVDCGLFQGFKNLRQLNWAPFPFNPAEIDAVILTHAHLDHSGALPLLVRQGFSGTIFASEATVDVVAVLLKDSAKLQEEEAEYANRHHTSKHSPAQPLYNSQDVEETMGLFETIPFDQDEGLLPDVSIRLQHAGHILGAASVRVKLGDPNKPDHCREILFSGDLGRPDAPIMMDPAPVGKPDYVVMESTYGNRTHKNEDPTSELAAIINETAGLGGAVLIPSFALGRAQVLLLAIAQMKADKIIGDVPVFLDSPMAINMTELYERHHKDHRFSRQEIAKAFDVAYSVKTVEESKALNALRYPRVIISASGMATGGRVLHHLRTLVSDHRNAVVFAGFQAAGTRGARMLSGEPTVRIFGQDLQIKARLYNLEGYSAHADADQLLTWLGGANTQPRRVFLNHGEPQAADILRQRVERELGLECQVPLLGEKVSLD
ncbi:MBL fold metallo-hydrolase RNA specificity domain-containing protein [Orrella marina]|uniref:MBL fold metallo-hydrolase RNA specificity domain-containing protein n=1 Tax=Orrella marina TaxID=2163011 RepID=UPI001D131256|nr:MBL fold metallo-hydrolase [Orrella marina]